MKGNERAFAADRERCCRKRQFGRAHEISGWPQKGAKGAKEFSP
jgi:hypothetical protein